MAVHNCPNCCNFLSLSLSLSLYVSSPVLTVQVRVLKDILEVSDIPVVKSIMEKFISYGFKTLLVFPGKQQVDFTPAPLPGPEWEGLRVFGLSQGVLTVRIECENMDNAKKSGKKLNHLCVRVHVR